MDIDHNEGSISLEERAVLEQYESWNVVLGDPGIEPIETDVVGSEAMEYSSCGSFCSSGACSAGCRSSYTPKD